MSDKFTDEQIANVMAALNLLEGFGGTAGFDDKGQLVIETGVHKGDWDDLDTLFSILYSRRRAMTNEELIQALCDERNEWQIQIGTTDEVPR